MRLFVTVGLGFGLVAGFDTGGFARELAKIGDLVATDDTVFHHFDLGNGRGVDGEGPLNADARRDFADGEGLRDTTATAGDDNAFKNLVALFLVLDDADVHFDGVARGELRDVVAELRRGDFIREVKIHVYSSR